MTDLERQSPDESSQASELEGGGTEQTWGQGEGRHDPTIPDDDSAAPTAGGTATGQVDAVMPLTRDDTGPDR